MSEKNEIKEEIRTLAETLNRGFEGIEIELKAVRHEMEYETGEIKDLKKGVDKRLQNVAGELVFLR